MKRKLKLVTLAMLGIAIIAIPSANAQRCNVPPILKKLLKDAKVECKKQGGSDATLEECSNNPQIIKTIVDIWNRTAGPSPPTEIGARLNNFDIPQNGNLPSVGKRRFYTTVSDRDLVSFTVKKTGGKAGCVIDICAVDESGVSTPMGAFFIPAAAPVGNETSRSVKLGKGNVLLLSFNGNGIAGTAFKYTLTTSK